MKLSNTYRITLYPSAHNTIIKNYQAENKTET